MSTRSRPRRNIIKPVFDYTAVKEEEWALRRALYASLRQSTGKSPTKQNRPGSSRAVFDNGSPNDQGLPNNDSLPRRKSARIGGTSLNSENPHVGYLEKAKVLIGHGNPGSFRTKKSLMHPRVKTRSHSRRDESKGSSPRKTRHFSRNYASNVTGRSNKELLMERGRYKRSINSQERDVERNDNDAADKRKRARKEKVEKLMLAQRKFASSQPCSPSSLLMKQMATPLAERPKTEDFIKFLCLRGTPALPKELEFLNSPCMPPSPLSSEDEEPQYPVSPYFRRQTTYGKSSPFSDTHSKTERQMSDSSCETSSYLSSNLYPTVLVESRDHFSEPFPSTYAGTRSTSALNFDSKPSTVSPKRSTSKKIKFDGKDNGNAEESGQLAFTRVVRSQRRKLEEESLTIVPPKRTKGEQASVSPKQLKRKKKFSDSGVSIATAAISKGASRAVGLKDVKGTKKKPQKKLAVSPSSSERPGKGKISPARRVKVKKKERTLIKLNKGRKDDSSPSTSKPLKKGHLKQKKSCSAVKERKGKLSQGIKKSPVKRSVPNGSGSKRIVKDAKGELFVSLSSAEPDSHVSLEEITVYHKKHANRPRNTSAKGFEKAIPPGPVLKPMEQEFKDPVRFLKKIESSIVKDGTCLVIPPEGWRSSTNIHEDIRFNTKVQHIHRMMHRCGSSSKKLAIFWKLLKEESVLMESIPQIGSCEVDLAHISDAMRLFGGLQQVTNTRKWQKLADYLRLPKNAHGRVSRLQDIYFKYVLPYDSLTEERKKSLEAQIEKEIEGAVNEVCNEGVEIKGRSTSVAQFHRIACSAQEMYAEKNDTTSSLESKFWSVVEKSDKHVAALIGEIDASSCGPAFQVSKNKSSWNLSQLPLSSGSALHGLGAVQGITTPTIKFGSIFSTSRWMKKEEGFYLVDYLHAGASRIWYVVPAQFEEEFRILSRSKQQGSVKEDMVSPQYLISPKELINKGIPVTRVVQNERQFIVITPNVYHCIVNTGYCCSESVNFAPLSWLLSHRESNVLPVDKLLIYAVKEEIERTKLSEHAESFLKRFQLLRKISLKTSKALLKAGISCGETRETLDSMQVKQKKNVLDWQYCTACGKPCFLFLVNFGSSAKVLCPSHAIKEALVNKESLLDMESFAQLSENEWGQLEKRLVAKIVSRDLSKGQ